MLPVGGATDIQPVVCHFRTDKIYYFYKKKDYLKKAFSILMITAMMLPNLKKVGILIDFKINQDFIAEVLCINKEKPMSTCNGKCYLSEQLKKAEEQEEKQAPTNKKERLEVIYCYSENLSDFLPFIDDYKSKLKPAYENEFYHSSFIPDIFHPPKLYLI